MALKYDIYGFILEFDNNEVHIISSYRAMNIPSEEHASVSVGMFEDIKKEFQKSLGITLSDISIKIVTDYSMGCTLNGKAYYVGLFHSLSDFVGDNYKIVLVIRPDFIIYHYRTLPDRKLYSFLKMDRRLESFLSKEKKEQTLGTLKVYDGCIVTSILADDIEDIRSRASKYILLG